METGRGLADPIGTAQTSQRRCIGKAAETSADQRGKKTIKTISSINTPQQLIPKYQNQFGAGEEFARLVYILHQ